MQHQKASPKCRAQIFCSFGIDYSVKPALHFLQLYTLQVASEVNNFNHVPNICQPVGQNLSQTSSSNPECKNYLAPAQDDTGSLFEFGVCLEGSDQMSDESGYENNNTPINTPPLPDINTQMLVQFKNFCKFQNPHTMNIEGQLKTLVELLILLRAQSGSLKNYDAMMTWHLSQYNTMVSANIEQRSSSYLSLKQVYQRLRS